MKTTDNQQELFILVDTNDTEIGYRTRGECHHDPTCIHRSVGVCIFNKRGEILLQKRSMTKDLNPGQWGISAAGHLTKGDTYETALFREMKEELGIDIPVSFRSKFLYTDTQESEFNAVYTGLYEGPFFPDPTEVDRVRFFGKKELEDAIRNKTVSMAECAKRSLEEVHFL